MKVLIVEDREINRKVLRASLLSEKVDVVEAHDGVEALKLLGKNKVDAVISDILMPNMDGYVLCRQIRSDRRFKEIPVIMYTSTYLSPADEVLALKMGAEAYIKKPASSAVLLAALRKAIQSRESGKGKPPMPAKEAAILKEYNEVLIKKLEEKNIEIEEKNSTLAVSNEKFRLIAQRLSLATESARLGIWDLDLETNKLIWDKRTCEMYGIRPEDFSGDYEAWREGVHPDDSAAASAEAREAIAGKKDYHTQFRVVWPQGQVRHIEAHAIVTRGPDGKPERMIGVNRDITERKQAEAELERLKTAVEQAGESIIITDSKGTILFVNPAFEATSGHSREEAVGKNPRLLKSGKHEEAFYRELWKTISSGRTWKGRIVNKRKDGALREEDETISPVRDAGGRIVNYVAVKRDVTENIRLERELRQAQKMESVGRLAGGVAHDFNNILTAINGYATFARAGLAEGDQRLKDLNEVLAAGERATRLTRQLLAFSRRQILNPEILDLNGAVGAIVSMLKRLIGEDIRLVTRLAPCSCQAKVDAGQIEQVFLNLAINARDAMPKGGTLTFETRIVAAAEDFSLRHPDLPRGPLVCLITRDTGCGMTEEVRTHLFEPFFTTKEKGKGTGLGLSTVYGIIKQSGGAIEVESEPDRGTTFLIYLPQTDLPAQKHDKDRDEDKDVAPGGDETVLLVEDEEIIRRLGLRALSAGGYSVLTAADGREALHVLARHGKAVDLLITDVVMPGMSGRELAQAIASKKMARKTLFISGFTDEAIVKHGVLEPGLAFMYKPFTPAALLRKLREVLDGPADKAKP